MIKKSILILCVIVNCFMTVNAQNNIISIEHDTIRWQVSSFYDESNHETLNETGSFILKGGLNIKWIQDADQATHDFTIVNREGNWPDLSQNGSMTFMVERNNRPGKIVFTRTSERTSIRMEFIRDNINVMPFTFNVIGLEKM